MAWNPLKKFITRIQESDNEPLYEQISQLQTQLYQTVAEKKTLEDQKNHQIGALQQQVSTLQAQLDKSIKEEELETYWNTKRQSTDFYKYPARCTPKNEKANIDVDPRIFFNPIDSTIPTVYGKDNDDIAMNTLKYVINNITYMTDEAFFKRTEEWLYANETKFLKIGDCEDGSILLANILLKSGIPYWRIRLNAGDVKGGGHCWTTYLRESDNEWIVLDWCYYPKESLKGLAWKQAENYFSIWFSWNNKHIFASDMLDREKKP